MKQTEIDEFHVADAWNGNAEQWASDVRSGYDKYRDEYTFPAFLKFIPSVEGCDVIDLGCGEGTNTRQFAKLGGKMTGVDISERMISLASEKEKQSPLGIRYDVQSYSNLSFKNDQFDFAVSTMALMDGPDFSSAMREAFRVLKSNGTLCFSVLHPCIMTSEFEWIQADDGSYLGCKVGRYFDKQPFDDRWYFSRRPPTDEHIEKFQVPRFPRILSEYINAVCQAGFRLTAIDEPRPSEAAVQKHPWFSRWRDHVPLVLFISATKA